MDQQCFINFVTYKKCYRSTMLCVTLSCVKNVTCKLCSLETLLHLKLCYKLSYYKLANY